MPEIRTPADLFDADPLDRISFFGDLQVQATQVEVFADPNRTDSPREQVQTVADAVKEAAALQGRALRLIEALFDEMAYQRDIRERLEQRVSELEAAGVSNMLEIGDAAARRGSFGILPGGAA